MLMRRLKPLMNEDDILWIYDNPLLPFDATCRKFGMKNRIGFFLHISTSKIFNALPLGKEPLEKLCEHDLLGFQAESDRQAFIENPTLVTTVEDWTMIVSRLTTSR
ncbi:MAG: hypothetical protein GPOALKHO_000396 [Sodalis sp.]|nr:MAG: hypothetical protein GPOALKHO_000396 [Sodalis sp.]